MSDIVQIREQDYIGVDTPLFETYKSHFQEWLRGPQSPDDTRFAQVHMNFLAFLQNHYVPAIEAKITGAKKRDTKLLDLASGIGSGLLAAAATHPFISTIHVKGFPLASMVTAYIAAHVGAIATARAGVITDKVGHLLRARTVQARMNQYKAQRISPSS